MIILTLFCTQDWKDGTNAIENKERRVIGEEYRGGQIKGKNIYDG